jgi:hypothetical protein
LANFEQHVCRAAPQMLAQVSIISQVNKVVGQLLRDQCDELLSKVTAVPTSFFDFDVTV